MPPLLAVRAVTIAPFFVFNYLFLFDLSIEEGTHFCRKNDWGEPPKKMGIGPDERYKNR